MPCAAGRWPAAAAGRAIRSSAAYRGWSRARPRPPAGDEEKGRGGEKETVTGTQLVTDEAFKPGVEKRRRDHWMLAHFLLLASAERERGLREYIRLWQLGVPSPEAFERAIGRWADDLYRGEVARYAERGFRARTFPLVGSSPDEDVKARPADAAELHALAHGSAGGRWIATGGGGYQWARVAPRAWTIAFAEMAGVELDDRLPEVWIEEAERLVRAEVPARLSEPTEAPDPAADADVDEVVELVRRRFVDG